MQVIHSAKTLLHNPPYELLGGTLVDYKEVPDRINLILAELAKYPNQFALRTSTPIEEDTVAKWIQKVHRSDYYEYIKTSYEEWLQEGGSKDAVLPEVFPLRGVRATITNPRDLPIFAKAGFYCFDLSCPITNDTFVAAWAAVEVTLEAAKELHDLSLHPTSGSASEHKTGKSNPLGTFALTRPPGHHAGSTVCGGYCYFNNVAIAARSLQKWSEGLENGPPRIAILDVDYHHGNGTQEIFFDDDSVLYVSLHADGDYPYFTGASTDGDVPEGRIKTKYNFPLPQYTTGDEEYIQTLISAADVVKEFRPQFVLVSLGVDTYKDDPICNFSLTSDCYTRMGRVIQDIGVPTLFVLEGGYHLDTIGVNVVNCLRGFLVSSE